jgi:hypothetical protein
VYRIFLQNNRIFRINRMKTMNRVNRIFRIYRMKTGIYWIIVPQGLHFINRRLQSTEGKAAVPIVPIVPQGLHFINRRLQSTESKAAVPKVPQGRHFMEIGSQELSLRLAGEKIKTFWGKDKDLFGKR